MKRDQNTVNRVEKLIYIYDQCEGNKQQNSCRIYRLRNIFADANSLGNLPQNSPPASAKPVFAGWFIVATYRSGACTSLPRLVTWAYVGGRCSCSGSGSGLLSVCCPSRCFGGLPLLGGNAGSMGRLGSGLAGFSRSTVMLSSLSPHWITKYFSCRFRTQYGPVYGVCRGPCEASRRTNTNSASHSPLVCVAVFCPCHASGTGTRRPAISLIH